MACSSMLRCAFAICLISLMTSSRSEYHCSSSCRPDLHLLPHLLSNALMEGWRPSPTIHSRQSASTILTEGRQECSRWRRHGCRHGRKVRHGRCVA